MRALKFVMLWLISTPAQGKCQYRFLSSFIGINTTDIEGRSQTCYTARVMALSAVKLQLVIFGSLQNHTRGNKCKQNKPMIIAPMCVLILPWCSFLTYAYLHIQIPVDAGDIRT